MASHIDLTISTWVKHSLFYCGYKLHKIWCMLSKSVIFRIFGIGSVIALTETKLELSDQNILVNKWASKHFYYDVWVRSSWIEECSSHFLNMQVFGEYLLTLCSVQFFSIRAKIWYTYRIVFSHLTYLMYRDLSSLTFGDFFFNCINHDDEKFTLIARKLYINSR